MKRLLSLIIICGCTTAPPPGTDPGPDPPSNVRYENFRVTWDPNTEEDLSHYLSHHGNDSTNYQDVQMTLETFALWPDLDGAKNHVFAVQAVDFAGNVSDMSKSAFVPSWFEIDSDSMYAGDDRVTLRNVVVIQKGQWGDPPVPVPGWHIWQVGKEQIGEIEFQITGKGLSILYLAGEDDVQDFTAFVDGEQVIDLQITNGDDQPHWIQSEPFDAVDKQCLIRLQTGGEYFRTAVIVIEK